MMQADQDRILVVDDDIHLRKLLEHYLGGQGYQVASVGDAPSMDRYLRDHHVDLFVLDLMLPGEDGLAIARRLRAASGVPIIILSARGEEIDRIVGLEIGADDYLPKPFNPRELLARVRAVLRRQRVALENNDSDQRVFRFDGFELDFSAHTLQLDGQGVALTSGEIALLEAFARNPNRVLSRDRLTDLLKGYERSPFDRSVDVRITRLRRKIEPDPSAPVYIRTVWGEGYRFTPGRVAGRDCDA